MQVTTAAAQLAHTTLPGDIAPPALRVEPKCPAAAPRNEIVHRFDVQPDDVGGLGFVAGATVLAWIDATAHAVAAQWSGGRCVTASVGNFHLDRTIAVGERVQVHAGLVYTGRSSLHILVTFCTSDPTGRRPAQIAQCPIVLVAVDDFARPIEVTGWTPDTMLELQRQRQARVRIAMRKRVEAVLGECDAVARDAAPAAVCFREGPVGRVGAGRVLGWLDHAACRCVSEWTGAPAIMSYLTGVRLERPVLAGDVIEVTGHLLHTGPRSVHVGVRVTATNAAGAQRVAYGVAVAVAVDDRGAARPVPQWVPRSDEDRQRDHCARRLVELRQFMEPFTTATPVRVDTDATSAH